jgi:predicted regulator of Ras-like GTPase activity (Roadblock/LC7/MglB family)
MNRSSLIDVAAQPRLLLVARCAELLAELQRDTMGVLSATVATADGLAVASTLAGRSEVDKLSAMSGSIAALASALTRETGHGEPERVILESTRGHIVSMKVPSADASLVLTVVTDNNAVLGKLLWQCRATSERIAAFAADTRH